MKIGTSTFNHGLEKLMKGNGHFFSHLEHSFADNFFNCGDAVFDFDQPRAAQADHARLGSFLLDVDGRSAREDELADFVADHHDFDQTDATLVASVVALVASPALHDFESSDLVFFVAEVHKGLRGDVDDFLAGRADAAHE